jgi:hypothetical protein
MSRDVSHDRVVEEVMDALVAHLDPPPALAAQ